MTSSKRHLILKLARLQHAADQAADRHAEAYHYDSAFDAGEFSGPAHERALAHAQDVIAQRFGFESFGVAMDAASALGALVTSAVAHGFDPDLPR